MVLTALFSAIDANDWVTIGAGATAIVAGFWAFYQQMMSRIDKRDEMFHASLSSAVLRKDADILAITTSFNITIKEVFVKQERAMEIIFGLTKDVTIALKEMTIGLGEVRKILESSQVCVQSE